MHLKQFVLFAIACLAPVCVASETVGHVKDVKSVADGVEVRSEGAVVRITALSPSVVRIRYSRSGEFNDKISFAVVPETGFIPATVHVLDRTDSVIVDTGAFDVRIEKDTTRVVFAEHTGKVILEDSPGSPLSWTGNSFRTWKTMSADEHYFALGDKAGNLDHRNEAYTLWNTDPGGFDKGTDPLYKSIPFFIGMIGSSAYGVFLDNTYWSSFDFGKERRDAISFGAEDGELDYYFFYGPDPKSVVREYVQLTGRTPLPPLFMLGYQQSRWTYTPESRAREIAQEFRSRKIPADAIWLDIGYQQDNAPFTVNQEEFPDFKGFIHDVGEEGFKIILITDLHIKRQPGYKPYDEGMERDEFVKNPDGSVYVGPVWPGPSVFPDFTRSGTRKWWGTLYTDFVNMGVRGFWNDMNEPSVFNSEKTMPLNIVHRVDAGGTERLADHREIHNVYGMENVRATYEGLLVLRPDVRPVVMTRAAYAGTQRYAATWTGDTQSTWAHLGLSVPMLLNLGLSGYPLAGADIGGFGGSVTPDLLTRWIELGAFNTIDRNHSSLGTANQEPWVGSPEQVAIRRRFIEARYRLLPYIYTSMEETSRTGIPLMRPMFLEFPSEGALATNDREFMFGPDLLVAPQLSEMTDPLHVELPAGEWYDYWSGQRVMGSHSFDLHVKLDELPVFARAGAIVAQQPVIQYVEETPQGPLELRVFPGNGCHGSLYADDGETFGYKRGVFSRTQISCSMGTDRTEVNMAPSEGSYRPWWKELRVVVYGMEKHPNHVLVDGELSEGWNFDPSTHSVSVQFVYRSSGQRVEIDY